MVGISGSGRTLQIGSVLLNVLFIIMLVAMTIQNRELKRQISDFATVQPPPQLNIGEKLSSFGVKELGGQTSSFDFSDPAKRYLLFVFSTTCPHCQNNLFNWKSLAALEHSSYEVVGLSIHDLEKTREYFATQDLNFNVFVVDTSFMRVNKIWGVPQTIAVQGDGTVEHIYVGELKAEQVNEIISFLGASPALTNKQQSSITK